MERTKEKRVARAKKPVVEDKVQEEVEQPVEEAKTPEIIEEKKEEVKEEVIIQNPDEVKIRFRKVGGGSLRLGNRIIKPGQVFTAAPKDIPKAFRDLVVAVGGNFDFAKPAPLPPPVVGKKPTYKLQPRGESKTLFDVVDAQGKVLNDKGLKKEIAEQLIEDLSK